MIQFNIVSDTYYMLSSNEFALIMVVMTILGAIVGWAFTTAYYDTKLRKIKREKALETLSNLDYRKFHKHFE